MVSEPAQIPDQDEHSTEDTDSQVTVSALSSTDSDEPARAKPVPAADLEEDQETSSHAEPARVAPPPPPRAPRSRFDYSKRATSGPPPLPPARPPDRSPPNQNIAPVSAEEGAGAPQVTSSESICAHVDGEKSEEESATGFNDNETECGTTESRHDSPESTVTEPIATKDAELPDVDGLSEEPDKDDSPTSLELESGIGMESLDGAVASDATEEVESDAESPAEAPPQNRKEEDTEESEVEVAISSQATESETETDPYFELDQEFGSLDIDHEKTESGQPPPSQPEQSSQSPLEEDPVKEPVRRSLSSLVAKGSDVQPPRTAAQNKAPASEPEPGDFFGATPEQPARPSKFASALSSSLGGTVSMRSLMEAEQDTQEPGEISTDEPPEESSPDLPVNEPDEQAVSTESVDIEVGDSPAEAQLEEEEKRTIGSDGLPEPWMNLGKAKNTGEVSAAPGDRVSTQPEADSDTYTTGGEGQSSEQVPPQENADAMQWVSISSITEKSETAQQWEPEPSEETSGQESEKSKNQEPQSNSQRPPPARTPGTLGVLQRTSSDSWVPLQGDQTWDGVNGTVADQSGQDFNILQEFSVDIPKVVPDSEVSSETAEEAHRKGNVSDACRQYHILIERIEDSPSPDIQLLVRYAENLADLYILLDDPASATSFYHKARTLAAESEPRRIQKYLSALLKLTTKYEEEGNFSEAERVYVESIKVASDELQEGDPLHQRLNEAYVLYSKRKAENVGSASFEEQCTTLRMKAIGSSEKSFSTRRKPGKDVALEEKPQERAVPDKARRATGSDIEFAAVKSLEELSGHPLMRALNTLWMQLILAVVLFMCGIAIVVTLKFDERYERRPLEVTLSGAYRTANTLKVVDYKAENKLSIWDMGNTREGTYEIVRGDSDDLFNLLKGYLRKNTIFFKFVDQDTIVDNEGLKLFSDKAPEMEIVKRMWGYAHFAQWQYREKRCYPTSSEPWSKSMPEFKYVNPFSGKPNFATITPSQGAANKLLSYMVASGQFYEGEPPGGPGAIRCVVFDKVRFFIRGFDRDGLPIGGNQPGKLFAIELTDGENITEKQLKTAYENNTAIKDAIPFRVVVVTENQDLGAAYQSWITAAPAFIILFLLVSVLVTTVALAKKRELRWYHYLTTIASILLTVAWFGFALM